MSSTEPLLTNRYYHIYNRGINGCNIFTEPENFEYFLLLYEKHISPIADTFAYILIPNHFHLLVRFKDLSGFENLTGLDNSKPPHQYFSNLFNAYTKAFNKRNERHGTLFERPFKRKLIDSEECLKQIILYIHNNPVHHNFCNHPIEYGWSSYLAYISNRATKLKRNDIIELFGDKANFEYCHTKPIVETSIEKYLEI